MFAQAYIIDLLRCLASLFGPSVWGCHNENPCCEPSATRGSIIWIGAPLDFVPACVWAFPLPYYRGNLYKATTWYYKWVSGPCMSRDNVLRTTELAPCRRDLVLCQHRVAPPRFRQFRSALAQETPIPSPRRLLPSTILAQRGVGTLSWRTRNKFDPAEYWY